MKKTLSPIGNSLGLILDKALLELLRIERDTELELFTDGDQLIIRPVRPDPRDFDSVAQGILERHTSMFEELAK